MTDIFLGRERLQQLSEVSSAGAHCIVFEYDRCRVSEGSINVMCVVGPCFDLVYNARYVLYYVHYIVGKLNG